MDCDKPVSGNAILNVSGEKMPRCDSWPTSTGRALNAGANFPNQPFAGEVTQILPSSQTVQNVATYDVVISASNPDLLLKPGMTATIRIVVERRDDVLRTPNRALRFSPRDQAVQNGPGGPRIPPDGWSQLWILRDGKPTAIPVQLGLDDDANTEIVEGDTRPGDEIIIGESGSV
jgi:HlyD family secretion protein